MFGHGAENCRRKKICMICANSDHSTNDCSFKNAENISIVLKCGNCHTKKLPSNHRADDVNCPCRLAYLAIRQRSRNQRSGIQDRSNQNSGNQQSNVNQAGFAFRDENFPSLPKNRLTSNNQQPSTSTSQSNANDANNGSFSGSNNGKKRSYADVGGQNLLSANEFFEIFDDALARFYACRTATDQIALIASLLRRAIR